jgi:hypothetical protein
MWAEFICAENRSGPSGSSGPWEPSRRRVSTAKDAIGARACARAR